jgi:hypothetical protein
MNFSSVKLAGKALLLLAVFLLGPWLILSGAILVSVEACMRGFVGITAGAGWAAWCLFAVRKAEIKQEAAQKSAIEQQPV